MNWWRKFEKSTIFCSLCGEYFENCIFTVSHTQHLCNQHYRTNDWSINDWSIKGIYCEAFLWAVWMKECERWNLCFINVINHYLFFFMYMPESVNPQQTTGDTIIWHYWGLSAQMPVCRHQYTLCSVATRH